MKLFRFMPILVVVTFVVACAVPTTQSNVALQLHSTSPTVSVVTITSVATEASEPAITPTTTPLSLLPRPGGHSKPTWSRLEFPPRCSFSAISPDWQWVLLVNCPPTDGSHSGDRIVHVDEAGNLISSQVVSGTFGISSPTNMVIGFTSDSAHLIVYQDGILKLVDPVTLTMSPFSAESRGTSGVSNLGGERWSLDGKYYFGRVCLIGCDGRLSVVDLTGQEESAIEIGRLGTLDNWCGGGDDVVYIQRYGDRNLRAVLFDNTTHQSQVLFESQIPNILTGVSCSPDGKWIVVRQYDAKSKETVLWLIDTANGSRDQLRYQLSDLLSMNLNNGWRDLVWSPDGTKLAVRGSLTDTDDGYIVVSISTGKPVFVGDEAAARDPLAWSKDGRSLLVLDHREQGTSPYLVELLEWIAISQ